MAKMANLKDDYDLKTELKELKEIYNDYNNDELALDTLLGQKKYQIRWLLHLWMILLWSKALLKSYSRDHIYSFKSKLRFWSYQKYYKDNLILLNYFPIKYSKITKNQKGKW